VDTSYGSGPPHTITCTRTRPYAHLRDAPRSCQPSPIVVSRRKAFRPPVGCLSAPLCRPGQSSSCFAVPPFWLGHPKRLGSPLQASPRHSARSMASLASLSAAMAGLSVRPAARLAWLGNRHGLARHATSSWGMSGPALGCPCSGLLRRAPAQASCSGLPLAWLGRPWQPLPSGRQ